METKEIKIDIPAGYVIDKENSTSECIRLKLIKSKFSNYDGNFRISGFYIKDSQILSGDGWNIEIARDIFTTEKQAKSALAMAQISQIMANDERFGGVITDEEWEDELYKKYVIDRFCNRLLYSIYITEYSFIAFHKPEQRTLFLQENEQLVKDYLMLD